MAAKLLQLQSKACQASQFVAKHGTVYYKQLLEQNKQYIQEPATVEKCNLLAKQLFYTRLARRGYDVVMTTSLSLDVPVGYFSWAEYDMMAPVQPKTEKALAAAFISNCGTRNFRLQRLVHSFSRMYV
ncbi:hypothetical protein K2173_015010 [Erythroxylum novogranatense]|uniref:Uncharacterized protein n=1 Tax=Erythroxylum novogranatense TaxID=1862640 RepID=A0AAV8TTW7_9ROSI|nr:hypothetical protein K2173_015010 [Erythroxylum novogranatense]